MPEPLTAAEREYIRRAAKDDYRSFGAVWLRDYEATCAALDAENARLCAALERALTALPDASDYDATGDWAWNELSGAEQERVKAIRRELTALLGPR